MSYLKRKVYGSGKDKDLISLDSIPFTEKLLNPLTEENQFKQQVFEVIRELKLWDHECSDINKFKLRKIKGALTNIIYEAIYDDSSPLLLRVFGAKLEAIVARSYEIKVLQRLRESQLRGPVILGCFANGRFEAYVRGSASVARNDLADPWVMQNIAMRMNKLHTEVELTSDEQYLYGSCFQKLSDWFSILETVGEQWISDKKNLEKYLHVNDWQFFKDSVATYRDWCFANTHYSSQDNFVFCHNDLQHGNVLLIDKDNEKNKNLMLIDFEYAGPNPVAFDISNHMSEWMHDYDRLDSYKSDYDRYPSKDKIDEFIDCYLHHSYTPRTMLDKQKLKHDIELWRPCAQLFWSVWAILQSGTINTTTVNSRDATPEVNGKFNDEPEFQYLLFCKEKLSCFWGDLIQFNLVDKNDNRLIAESVNYLPL